MAIIDTRRMREASLALECQSGSVVGASHREIHFQVFDDRRRNVLTLVAMLMGPIAQWSPEPPEVSSDRTAWSFHLSHQTIALAVGTAATGMLFWDLMRAEFRPITPTPIQAAVMRAYVLLWSRLFGTRPPRSVELDLNQMGIFDVHLSAGRYPEPQGWDSAADAADAHRVWQAERAGILERMIASEMSGRRIAKDTGDDPVKALAAPSSKLPVYRPS